MEIAQRLDCMTDSQCAMAELKILQIVTDMEYPPDPKQYPQSMPYSSIYYETQCLKMIINFMVKFSS